MSDATIDRGIRPFEQDVAHHGRYIYADAERLSCRLANARITRAVLAAADFADAGVIDIGCGDGTFSQELAAVSRSSHIHGIDPAANAIDSARRKTGGEGAVTFEVANAYALPQPADAFDLALFRGVLHHMERPIDALAEGLRVAPTVVVVEPNGLNPGLKLFERFSRYHVEHAERSYPPRRLDRWVASLGARTTHREWIGFVPMFSPDWYARLAKRLEVPLERLPGLRSVSCAQYVFAASRESVDTPPKTKP
jgi:SAM-dependent methyltransferase